MFKLCNSDDFKIKFRLSRGMIAMFDNLRLLHGRTKFDPNTGFRHLQGCYTVSYTHLTLPTNREV